MAEDQLCDGAKPWVSRRRFLTILSVGVVAAACGDGGRRDTEAASTTTGRSTATPTPPRSSSTPSTSASSGTSTTTTSMSGDGSTAPPELRITFPEDRDYFCGATRGLNECDGVGESVTFRGRVTPGTAVTGNGLSATVAGGEWSMLLRLTRGWNRVEFVARNPGGTASQAIQIFYTEVEESVKGGACYNDGVCS